jgi:hypothetical protein
MKKLKPRDYIVWQFDTFYFFWHLSERTRTSAKVFCFGASFMPEKKFLWLRYKNFNDSNHNET